MKTYPPLIEHDILLIGAGHAQLSVIRRLAMRPVDGLRAVLVNDGRRTPYSGMLPGCIAGHYQENELYIDLDQLCGAADVEFVEGKAVQIDPVHKEVTLASGTVLSADALSLNPGGAPLSPFLKTKQPPWLLMAKPIAPFWQSWLGWQQRLAAISWSRVARVLVVGGGAAGVELAFAVNAALRGGNPERVQVTLASNSKLPLPDLGPGAGSAVLREFEKLSIGFQGESTATLTADAPHLNGVAFKADLVIWAAGVAAAPWLAESGLACDARGFASVDGCLQSISHPGVFVAGDAVDFRPKKLPKAGIYSVRMGPIIAENLIRYAQGKPLKPYVPQAKTLFLLGNGRGKALACYAGISFWANWFWRWKDRIDRKFIVRFGVEMQTLKQKKVWVEERKSGQKMRCEACAAKVEAGSLVAALKNASVVQSGDAAIFGDRQWLQSVDAMTSPLGDPYLHGFIAVIHALSDLYVSGQLLENQRPKLAIQVTVGRGRPAIEANRLLAIMHGVKAAAAQEGADIITGHSATGPVDQVSVTVTGRALPYVPPQAELPAEVGIFLSKPLGVGALLVARRLGAGRALSISAAIASMKASNRRAAECAMAAGALALTDVTGFGLANHLATILPPTSNAVLTSSLFPKLPEIDEKVRSSLFQSNLFNAGYQNERLSFDQALAFDPQTSGGVLALVPMANAEQVKREFWQIGALNWALDTHQRRVILT